MVNMNLGGEEMSTMVCGCMKVTKEEIIKAVENGAKSFEEIQEATKISCGCGGCKEEASALVKKLLAKQ